MTEFYRCAELVGDVADGGILGVKEAGVLYDDIRVLDTGWKRLIDYWQ